MKISERIALIKAGYSKDEITEMVKEEKMETPTEEKTEMPVEYKDVIATLANEVKTLKEAVQRNNLKQAEAKAPATRDEDVVKILGSLVDPSLNKED